MTKLVFAASIATLAFAPFVQASPQDDSQTGQTSQTVQSGQTGQQPHDSALAVKPGPPVIKQKDLWERTGYFHPFVRMPKYILQDQKAIWTSPFHTSKKDAKYWAIFGGATVGLIASDKWTVKQLPNSSSQVSVSNWASRFGTGYFLIPVGAGFYFLGTAAHDERFRETGLLGFESLIDVTLMVEGLKIVADRARPYEGNGTGRFENSTSGRWSSGFPSGHAINTWAMASVVAHQYPHPRIIPIVAYGLAATVCFARVGARQHFPGDVVAGAAMGWFTGDFVYGKRHNRELDQKPGFAEKVISHVKLGFEMQP